MEEKDIFKKFLDQSTYAPILIIIEFVAVGLALVDCYPVRFTDYLFLLLRFGVCVAILLLAWVAIITVVNTILKKIKNLSEQALHIIWAIIPIIVLLVIAFRRMIEYGQP